MFEKHLFRFSECQFFLLLEVKTAWNQMSDSGALKTNELLICLVGRSDFGMETWPQIGRESVVAQVKQTCRTSNSSLGRSQPSVAASWPKIVEGDGLQL